MKIISKILALFICAAMISGIIPALSFRASFVAGGSCGAEGDNITWEPDTSALNAKATA